MSIVMKMLSDGTEFDEKDLCDPGLLSELTNYKTRKNHTTGSSSSSSRKHDDSQSYGNTTTSYPDMTFTTITYR
ncbi:hypothetical protein R6Q57_008489 [Mikania cordata]